MRPDLDLLRAKLDDLRDIVDDLELELVDDPRWGEPSDHSYLNATDRANPDIMANVEAMNATNALIDWFARDMEGFAGFWRGPDNTPIDKAAVVRLDSEGQYSNVAASVGDYLLTSLTEDNFSENHDTLKAAGFTVSATQKAIWTSCDAFSEPNDYRHTLYNAERKKRGLPPID